MWRVLFPAALTSIIISLALYAPILRFPYLFDDIIHLRWLEDQSVFGVWTSAKHMQHYRPLVTWFWAVSERWLAPHNPLPLHVSSLTLHILNGCLVGWLAACLLPGRFGPAIAAALFVSFPFSYQAMPSPGSQSKPMSTLLLLLACLLYWRGRTQRKPGSLWAGLLCAVLAPFSYEGAVTSGAYLLLIEVLLRFHGATRRLPLWRLTLLATGVPFLVAWQLVPSAYGTWSFPGWEALWQSSTYFAQGLVWPVALLAGPLMRLTGLSDSLATAAVAFPTIALLVGLYLRRRRWDILLVALGWFVLSLAIQWVSLTFDYVINGPRLLYTASVGVALLWADLIVCATQTTRFRRFVGTALAAVAVLAMLGWSADYVRERIRMCAVGAEALESASRLALLTAPDEQLLFLNVPAWMTMPQPGFALGHEGYTLLPPYYDISLDDYLWVNHGARRRIEMRGLRDIRLEWTYLVGYHGEAESIEGLADDILAARHVYVPVYAPDSFVYREVGGVLGQPDAVDLIDVARFGSAVALGDISAAPSPEGLQVTLEWYTTRPVDDPYTIFVHLYGADGALIGQTDGYAIGGTCPPRLWPTGKVIRDIRYIVTQPGALPEDAMLGIGLYRGDTGERAPALDADGQPLPDDILRVPLRQVLGR